MHASVRIGDTTVMASDGRCEGRPKHLGAPLDQKGRSLLINTGNQDLPLFVGPEAAARSTIGVHKGGFHMSHPKCLSRYSLAVVYVFALSAGAFATDHTNEGLAEARFKALDTDGDDKLSPDEHAAGAKRMFAAMDADKDGTVTVAEMDAAHKNVTGEGPEHRPVIRGKDQGGRQNGDGLLSAEEHAAGSKRMFHTMDIDNDGFLSRAELGWSCEDAEKERTMKGRL